MKTILMTSAAMLLTVGVAMAQTTAAGTGTSANGTATAGANSGMTGGTGGMTGNQTATGNTGNGTMSAANGNGNVGNANDGGATHRGPSPGGMSLTQIQHKLASEGYVHVKNLRHNSRYELVGAHRYGSYQKTLKINPTTGQVVDQPKLSDSQVRNMLKAHHYTDIDSVTHHGNVVTATAKKGGQKSKLTINAQTGKIQSS